MDNNFDLGKAINEAILRADADTPRSPAAPALTPLEVRAAHGAKRLDFALSNGNFPQIAEAYALLGEYEKAIAFAEGEQLAEYEKILAAIHGVRCDCPSSEGQGAKRRPTRHLREQFLRRGQQIDLYMCLKCGMYQL